MKPRAVLFDLFGTLVRFRMRAPTLRVGAKELQFAMPWLTETFRGRLPDADFDLFVEAIAQATADIVRARSSEHLEVPSRVRFQRALDRLGIAAELAAEHAEALSLTHMKHLAASVDLPEGHAQLLRDLKPRFRLGLVSNFDHGATARGILDRFDLTRYLETIVISEEFGRRKPHPAIFEKALADLGVGASEAIYVGDSPADDIAGARNAGMKVVWINTSGRELPDSSHSPDATIAALPALTDLID